MKRAYVIASKNGGTKIGVSANPERRLFQVQRLKTTGPCSVHFATEPREDAFMVEAVAHELLELRRIAGEWFDVTPEEAHAAIVQAIEKIAAGYSITALDTAAERQARKRQRHLAAGFVRVEEYVPAERVPELRTIAAAMRDQQQREQEQQP